MKKLLLIAVLLLVTILQGCGTIRGVGTLFQGIGKDIQSGSDGYNREYHNKHNK